jgi:crotonobetainyl-CoA:carnitine CoA-transferase CaiB-like acyl-CoA transferase
VRNGAKGIIPVDIPGIGPYECSDGHVYGYLGAPGGASWGDMLQWMTEEGMAEDLNEEPYYGLCQELNIASDVIATPVAKLKLLPHQQVLKRFVKSKTKWEMYEGAQSRRLLFGIVSTPEDIAKNPQLLYKKWLTDVDHPELGETLQYPGRPYDLAETPWAIRRRPPLRGEHTGEVLDELG